MGCFLTPVSLLQVYFVITFWTSQGLYLCRAAFLQRLISTWSISLLNYKLLTTSKFNSIILNNNIYFLQLWYTSLILVPNYLLLLYSDVLLSAVRLFHWASWIPSQSFKIPHWLHMYPLSDILIRCLCLGRVGVVGWGGGNIHHPEDLIFTRFISLYACARSCLGRIRAVLRCYVNPCLISGEGLILKYCGMETHGSRKWDPPLLRKRLYSMKRDIIFMNPFFFRAELSSDIVANLECTKRT